MSSLEMPIVDIDCWPIEKLKHNLNILYNYLGRRKVYVDSEGRLQLDNRWFFWTGTSTKAIKTACIHTLFYLTVALRSGQIQKNAIVTNLHISENPCILVEQKCPNSSINNKKFAQYLKNHNYFQKTMESNQYGPPAVLTEDQQFYQHVLLLAEMIEFVNEFTDI